ncbi:MAG TPA: flagellar motor switch protein FliG [Longimicrobiales bacterium]|nr:flagellar motor switch protein FliG [Longimicrobiales bacterium]
MTGAAVARRGTADEFTGRQKVAVLLMALGEEASAEITKNLSPEEIEAISFEIAKMDRVDPSLVEEVLNEWQHTEQAAFSLASGGVDYARRVLEKAFGSSRASQVLKRIESQLHDHFSLARLRNADPQQLAAIIRNEHPQTVALILAFLDPGQVAGVLKERDSSLGSDVLLRIARMEKVLPDVLRIIEDSVGAETDLSLSGDSSQAGGPAAVAEVLNLVSATLEKDLLDGVANVDPALSEQIKNLMFVFEDIVQLDDRGITRLLRDVETRELSLALKLASEELKARMLGSLSTRARDALVEEMEFLGPVRVSDVEAAQANIVKLARALEEAGEIVIGGGDDLVVT